jgi:hypothetical protein
MLTSISSACGMSAPLRRDPAWRQQIEIHREDDPARLEVEDFIRRVYATRYGAQINSFAPVLVSLRDDDGITAAAGYRAASRGPLFLERYLDAPIESLLSAQADAPSTRDDIVEVGHLAAARPGEGRRLIYLLAPQLTSQGFRWVASTLTKELRHLFIRIGITPLALGTASRSALGADANQWGSYFDHGPVVLAGHLQRASLQLARRPLTAEVLA